MRVILKQIMTTLILVGSIYGFMIALSFLVAPDAPDTAGIDSGLADSTIYSTSPDYVVFRRDALSKPGPKVVIVGASNADAGLRPAQIQKYVPCAVVNGLTIGGMNTTEMQQVVDLVHEVQDPGTIRKNTFVFGIWYGDFGDSKDRWRDTSRKNGETDVELALYRFGFFKRGPDGPQPVLPAAWLPVGKAVLRPFFVVQSVIRRLTGKLRETVFIRPAFLTEAEREARHFSPAEQRDAIAYWHEQLGQKNDVSQDQFTVFETMIAHLLDNGERVVVVDLPIPHWHQKNSVYDAKYRQRLPALVDNFAGRPGFSFYSMPDLDEDDAYSDEVHPKPHLAAVWAQRVGPVVKSAACPAANAASG